MVYSCNYIEKELLPSGKKCGVLLWSGNCLPDDRAMAVCSNAGILNMNGGDSRFDAVYPSYLNLFPLYRQVESNFQIHSSGSNENTYTHLWTRDFGGYQNVIQTFRKTENPRRVAPVNVYYHFYSGERHASLLALKKMYDWVQSQQLFPVFASHYINIVNGFISCDIDDLGNGRWRIANNGTCRTVRFDQCDLYPDLERSPGILGFRHYQGSLYLFLDQSPEIYIQLTDTKPDKPYLSLATADVNNYKLDDRGGLRYQARAFGKAFSRWSNMIRGGAYTVFSSSGDRTEKITGHADSNGTLEIQLNINETVEIYLEPVYKGVGLR